ncbi:MAG: OmpA family protein [Bacteroidetes bacterium]|nr:OmpA family protein [Bacteroidota bacterium]
MIHKNLAILLLLLCFFFTQAQSTDNSIVKADKSFIKKQYKEAAVSYEKFLKNSARDFYAARQAALCYSRLNEHSKAIDYWTIVADDSKASEKDKLEYAKCLLSNYRTDDAKKVFINLQSSKDKEVFAWSKTYFNPSFFYEDSALCKVIEVSGVNTAGPEYSPFYYKEHLLFIRKSSKKPRSASILSAEEVDSITFNKILKFNKQIQNKYANGALCFTPDDSTIYFTRTASVKETKKKAKDPNGTLKLQIFISAMNSFGLAHEEIHPFIYNSFEYNCMHPSISKNGKRLYFASDMPGSLGGNDIFVCEWRDGSWGQPKNLGEGINTSGNEMFPFIAADGSLYFTSDTRPGMGGLDIFFADPATDGTFGEAQNAGSKINTQFNDFGIYLFDKTNKGYLSSNRKNNINDDDIYYFINNKPKSFPAKIMFIDSLSRNSAAASFKIASPSGSFESSVDSGKYYSTRLKAGQAIDISVNAGQYVARNYHREIVKGDSVVVIELKPVSQKCIEGTIYDKDNNLALAGVKVSIFDEDGNKYLDQVTDATGKYSVCNLPLNKPLYIGSNKKPDYFSNTDKFVVRKDSDVVKNIYALKIVVGKAIKIDNIYFDVAKFNVRPDAALELDKLVKLMKDNQEVIIELSSHTDCNGAAASNLMLSDKRAKSAAAYIISKSISSKRIKGKGYGESKLVNDCKCEGKKASTCTEEQHAQNRRVEIKVTGFVGTKAKKK